MIHLMIDPNSASEFACAKGKDDKLRMNELFPTESIAARKPSFTYLADGRKLVNGQVESSISPKSLWQDTLIRGQLVHQMSDAKVVDHVNDVIDRKVSYSLGSDEKDSFEAQSSNAKHIQPREDLSEAQNSSAGQVQRRENLSEQQNGC